ncbi:MAG: hypothetical protein H7235_05535 [Bdellovibrionaceae bacterium]|nr:hypothetical protein [Pseudobdellovibrionaceae bacterium]
MKKILLVFATLMMAVSVFATEFTGRIISLNQDEEGMKVIVQVEKVSNSSIILYLDSKSKDFVKTIADLKVAKEKSETVKITATNDSLVQITKIQVMGK